MINDSYSTEFWSAYIINVNEYIIVTVVIEIDSGYQCVENNEIVVSDHWLSLNFKFNGVQYQKHVLITQIFAFWREEEISVKINLVISW